MTGITEHKGDPLAQASNTPDVPSAPDRWGSMRSFQTLYAYLYCVLASTVLVKQSVLGGALYMVGNTARLAIRLYGPARRVRMSKALRVSLMVLTVLSGMLALTVILVYPLRVDMPLLWLLFSLVLLISLHSGAVRHLWGTSVKRGMTRVQTVLRALEATLLFVGICALILFVSLPTETAWYLLGGFLLACLLGMFDGQGLLAQDAQPVVVADNANTEALDQVSLLTRFRSLRMITMTALQVTMILVFTFIALSANQLFLVMGLAFLFTKLFTRTTHAWLMRPRKRERDASTMLFAGLAIWLIGLILFSRHLTQANDWLAYLAVVTVTAGSTMAVIALDVLAGEMGAVAAFALNHHLDEDMAAAQALMGQFAALAGQMIALIGLALVLLFAGSGPRAAVTVQPALLVPALALVIAALPPALVFPLTNKYRHKLHTFLMLRENGETNLPLQKQLEDVVLTVSRKRYGIKLVMLALRPFFYNKVIGRENVKIPRNTSAILVCNHGELYGPIVTNLYVPLSFRPWVVSEMTDVDQVSDYVYRHTIDRQKWLPERFKRPVSNFIAPIMAWIMRSIESIPVYRDQPRALIKTFRDTVSAMEAGDHILLFPENPNDPGKAERGYVREGVGEFYTGFTMLAQMYHKQTGKIAQFIPIYADKKKRTLTFGAATAYDPDNAPNPEKQRIVDHLRGEMIRMGGLSPEGELVDSKGEAPA